MFLAAIDPELALGEVVALEERALRWLNRPRFNSRLLVALAGLALVLSLIGIYGVLSQSVAQRSREIGLRMALGAVHRDILRLI